MKNYTFFLLIFFMGCNQTNKWKNEIMDTTDFSLMTISNPHEQVLNKEDAENYCQDYKIKEHLLLSKEEEAQLKLALVNEANFSTENFKRCPFLPLYGIKIDSTLTATVSLDPCARVKFKSIKKGNTLVKELVEGNEIEEILLQFQP